MRCRFFTTVFVFLLSGVFCFGQQEGIDALKKDYPQLMEKFGHELENQRADYYFLVDVSGTMQQYKGIVVPALQEFFRSMQTDDYVSVIKFGGAAKNDIGSQGMVNDEIRKSLINYVPDLYKIPDNTEQKRIYYNYTDLEAMLLYLRKELHQPGRNNLKFIFIITDFVHDPTAEHKGKEDWDAIKRALKNEQSENFLNVFALLLPGKDAGRDLDKVRDVFPIDMELEEVQTSAAISEWFKHKKNSIMLEKFTALIRNKYKDAEVGMTPEFTMDGYLTLRTSWKQNELFERLSVDNVVLDNNNFTFKSHLPVVIDKEQGDVEVGRVDYKTGNFPSFNTYGKNIVAEVSLTAPYDNELLKLGFERQTMFCKIPATSLVYTFFLPFWLSLLIVILIILYIVCVVLALKNNRSAKYKINGTFVVRYQGDEVVRNRSVNRNKADIGTGAQFLSVAHNNCMWLIEIRQVTYNAFILFFKKPEFRVFMKRGSKFSAGGRKYMIMHHPRISPGGSIITEEFTIKWLK